MDKREARLAKRRAYIKRRRAAMTEEELEIARVKRRKYYIKKKFNPEKKEDEQESKEQRSSVKANVDSRIASKGDARPEFFKVFLPELTSQRLHIPQEFIKNYKGVIREKVILKDTSGNKTMWYVDVERTRDGIFLTKGWQEFINDHNIKIGEFMVFSYIGYYIFIVTIFGTNGCCRKEEALSALNDQEDD